jgi:hypothetical protein
MPGWELIVRPSQGGIQIGDSDSVAELTRREAAKWADIIKEEMGRFKAKQFDRGQIRTVFRWVVAMGR